jgi:hypothetical protein
MPVAHPDTGPKVRMHRYVDGRCQARPVVEILAEDARPRPMQAVRNIELRTFTSREEARLRSNRAVVCEISKATAQRVASQHARTVRTSVRVARLTADARSSQHGRVRRTASSFAKISGRDGEGDWCQHGGRAVTENRAGILVPVRAEFHLCLTSWEINAQGW